ncbi:MAG: helix-turn-helix domain-containing protein [Chthoniobacterales bacterium]
MNQAPAPETDQLLTKRDLAERLQVSTRTIDGYMQSGRLCFLKIGRTVRFRWPDVLAKLNASRVN